MNHCSLLNNINIFYQKLSLNMKTDFCNILFTKILHHEIKNYFINVLHIYILVS